MTGTHAPLAERLWRRCVEMPNGCIEWQGARQAFGHGRIGHGNGPGHTSTHRAAWTVTYGPIPEGMHVCHKCDNPPCCNPEHLFLGTNDDNVADKVAKGRAKGMPGEANPHARFSAADIAEMKRLRSEGLLQREIAERFGTYQGVVSNILTGRSRAAA